MNLYLIIKSIKHFKITILFTLAEIIIISAGAHGQSTDTRPNVLFIITDDHSQIDVGAYGNRAVKTPNMDLIAREGLSFAHAFTSTAMCVPSRSSLLTGLYPMRHGAHPNHAPIKTSVTSVAVYLDQLGYNVGLIGKVHVNPTETFGFHYLKDLLDYAWDAKLTKAEMLKALETLNQSNKPFVLFVCIANPHVPWPGEWDGELKDIVMPSYLLDNPETRAAVARYYAHVEFADRKVGEVLESAKQLNLYDSMLTFFTSDHGAELVHGKYTLYDAGIKVPFMARWPGKITANTKSEAMVSFVDVVPTLIELAGGVAPDTLDGQSILPVLLDQASELNDYIFATSSKDGKKTDYPIKAIRSKKYKYIINPEFTEKYTSWITDSTLGAKWPGYDRHYGYWLSWLKAANNNKDAKQLVDSYLIRPMEELYDLEADPDELNNLADDPSLCTVKGDLRRRLKRWLIDQNDVHYSERFFVNLPALKCP